MGLLALILIATGWGLAITCAIKWWHTAQDLHWEKVRHRTTQDELQESKRLARRLRKAMTPIDQDAAALAEDAKVVAEDMARAVCRPTVDVAGDCEERR